MMDWKEHYRKNTVSPDEAVALISPGDNIAISLDPKPSALMDAMVANHARLNDIRIFDVAPHYDPGWLTPDFEGSFRYSPSMFLGPIVRPAYYEHRIDFAPVIFTTDLQPYKEPNRGPRLDVTLVSCSPPDDEGYCSFGKSLWNKRSFAKLARLVLVQVDDSLIRTYGDNKIHVSEIDRFAEFIPPELTLEESEEMVSNVEDPMVRKELEPLLGQMSGNARYDNLPRLCGSTVKEIREFVRLFLKASQPGEEDRQISENVAELVRDGDTIQIGVGTPSAHLPRLGTFDQKRDLGWHSEMTAPGIVELIERGVINSERKNIHPRKAVFTALTGCAPEEVPLAHNNPRIELRDAEYVVNINTVSSHDNYIAMNNAISIDFSGQINSESIGGRQWTGTGGQPELHMGAVISKGGRAITLLRSTAAGGTVSRIVPQHPEGAVITIPRSFADTIVTEYGVAQLLGKTIRERAQELISVAHPDFRADLQKAADNLYYP